jgi:RNA polymerase sigma-70 factor, ECF subfamily
VQGWIVRVAHNLARDTIKRRERDRDIVSLSQMTATIMEGAIDPAFSPEEALMRKEQIRSVEIALSTLRPQQRQCLHMRLAGFCYGDIALALEISEQRAELIVEQALVELAALSSYPNVGIQEQEASSKFL